MLPSCNIGVCPSRTALSHANWPRTYAFEVNVAFIPEPATLSLLALGGLALLRRKRRAA